MSISFPPHAALSGKEWTWLVASYFIGCLTAGYYWVRWRTGWDIRTLGSGNVGARNVGRVLGAGPFTITLLLDIAKGALVVAGAIQLGLSPEALVACIVAVVAGHNWPAQLRFRGGKGVAVSAGALLAWDPFTVLCLVAIFLPAIAVLRSITLSAMVAFTLGPMAAFFCGLDKAEIAAMSCVALLVVTSHRKNIREEIGRRVPHRSLKEVEMHKGPHDEV